MKQALTREKKEIALRPKSPSTFLEEINELIRNVEKRAYQLFEWRGRKDGLDWEDWFKAEDELFKPVPVEIREKEDRLMIRAEVPGFIPDELEVSLEPSVLIIRGTQKQEAEKKRGKDFSSETREKEIFRRVALPVHVLPDDAEATLKDGVLEVSVLKAVGARKTQVAAA